MSDAELNVSPASVGTETTGAAPAGTTVPASTQPTGSAAAEGRPQVGPEHGSADEDLSFDPTTLSPEAAAYLSRREKEMQGMVTRKTQDLAKERREVELLKQYAPVIQAFSQNPHATLRQLAQQYGLTVQEAQQAVEQGRMPAWKQPDYQPGAWGDFGDAIVETAVERAVNEAMQKFSQRVAPIEQNLQKQTAQTIERQLDQIDPEWRTYEPDMIRLMEQHRTLATDPALLYRMAVPPEVIEQRATQAALDKLAKKQQASKVAGQSSVRSVAKPSTPKTIQEAWEQAKAALG